MDPRPRTPYLAAAAALNPRSCLASTSGMQQGLWTSWGLHSPQETGCTWELNPVEFLGCASPDAEVTAKARIEALRLRQVGGFWAVCRINLAYHRTVDRVKGFPKVTRTA